MREVTFEGVSPQRVAVILAGHLSDRFLVADKVGGVRAAYCINLRWVRSDCEKDVGCLSKYLIF